MPVTGSFKELAELKAKVAALATSGAKLDLNRVLAEAAMTQIDDEFRQSRDPYGQPWKPLVSREGQPLRDTGQLLNSLHPKVTDSGFEIATNRKGAATHQYGAVIKAKTPAGLVFMVQKGTRYTKKGNVRSYMGGGKNFGKSPFLKTPKAVMGFVRVMQVTIPRRQYMPEVNLGPVWTKAMQDTADDFLRARLGT